MNDERSTRTRDAEEGINTKAEEGTGRARWKMTDEEGSEIDTDTDTVSRVQHARYGGQTERGIGTTEGEPEPPVSPVRPLLDNVRADTCGAKPKNNRRNVYCTLVCMLFIDIIEWERTRRFRGGYCKLPPTRSCVLHRITTPNTKKGTTRY